MTIRAADLAERDTLGALDAPTHALTRAGLHPAPPYPVGKRVLDVVVAGVLLVLAAPLILVLAVLVRLEGGPVLFRQQRVGTGGRPITITKIRTMAPDAEERLRADPDLHAAYVAGGFKLPPQDDPRLSRLGTLLRSTSLDELPQLVAVLRGDLSMVGPRPIVAPEIVEYTRRGAEQAYLSCRPGLTGLWQVSGRSRLSYDDRVALDVEYCKDLSVATDLRILLQTPSVVLRRVGAH